MRRDFLSIDLADFNQFKRTFKRACCFSNQFKGRNASRYSKEWDCLGESKAALVSRVFDSVSDIYCIDDAEDLFKLKGQQGPPASSCAVSRLEWELEEFGENFFGNSMQIQARKEESHTLR